MVGWNAYETHALGHDRSLPLSQCLLTAAALSRVRALWLSVHNNHTMPNDAVDGSRGRANNSYGKMMKTVAQCRCCIAFLVAAEPAVEAAAVVA